MSRHDGVLSATAAPHPPAQTSAAAGQSGAWLCAVLLGLAVLLTHPVLEMGLNDDWSYIHTALDFTRTGHFVYNGWATAILGWQVLWGALFIRIFGFSFTVVRMSTLLVAMVAAWLLQRILVRSGINPWNATIGTLTLVLSPLFLPYACSFMSDGPGLFSILVCLYACQRALAAETRGGALIWLPLAAGSNILLGTVRQIAWLGALLMVPSTAWLLRRRRGALALGISLWAVSVLSIAAILHWFQQQPYSLPEDLIDAPLRLPVLHQLADQLVRLVATVLLFLLPVLVAFLTRLPPSPRGRLRLPVVCGAAIASLMLLLRARHSLGGWLAPWLPNTVTVRGVWAIDEVLGSRPVLFPAPLRLALTLLVLAAALALFAWIVSRPKVRRAAPGPPSTAQLAILLGPFALGYVALLAPRAAFHSIFDRYVLPLLVLVILMLLRYYQEHVAARLPRVSIVALLIFAAFGIAGMHDVFALDRARLDAAQEIRRTGVPRTRIRAGFEYDGWTQVEAGGYLNEPRLRVPAGAYRLTHLYNPNDACDYWFEAYTPAIAPVYYLTLQPLPCLRTSSYAPVPYRTWLPPTGQKIYIQQRETMPAGRR